MSVSKWQLIVNGVVTAAGFVDTNTVQSVSTYGIQAVYGAVQFMARDSNTYCVTIDNELEAPAGINVTLPVTMVLNHYYMTDLMNLHIIVAGMTVSSPPAPYGNNPDHRRTPKAWLDVWAASAVVDGHG